MTERVPARPRPAASLAISLVLLFGALVWFALVDHDAIADPATAGLALLGMAGALASARWSATVAVVPTSGPGLWAAMFLGPAPALVVSVVSDLVGWLAERFRPSAIPMQLAVTGLPNVVAGAFVAAAAAGAAHGSARFQLVCVAAVAIALTLNVALVTLIMGVRDGRAPDFVRGIRSLVPAIAFNFLFVATSAALYAEYGAVAAIAAVISVVAYAYMARLLRAARDRARAYANLSWGVLGGLVRALDERDGRAARHSAAVARFARDIAAACGMTRAEQELAHTAGLLHDIGRFALPDRVMERHGALTPEDWQRVRRHPELGAALLKDIGVYGPVAEIVGAHHERIDGRGYPAGLAGAAIPVLARVVAVAEVYDTLTAPDTYRPPLSSFEALTELRRVSGTQLDGEFVEALASVLAGTGVEYRHADEADFDAELDVERRVNEAAGD